LQWEVLEVLGTGTFARVVLGAHVNTHERVAIKIMYKELMRPNDRQRATREIEILKKLNHPNITKLHGVVATKRRFCMIMEYMDVGNLAKYLEDRKRLTEQEAKYLFRQLVDAVRYCHSQNVIHRDLKLSNILLNGDKTAVKLIDFGLSNYMMTGTLHNTFCGTPAFAPPEILMSQKYIGPEIDVWSLGVVLYAMIAGYLPFDNLRDIIEIKCKDSPTDVSMDYLDLMGKILTVSPKRLTVDRILMHSFLNQDNNPV